MIGLYELMDLLQDYAGDRAPVARAALEQIADAGEVSLRWKRWPGAESLGEVSLAELPADPWRRPDVDGRYLALERR